MNLGDTSHYKSYALYTLYIYIYMYICFMIYISDYISGHLSDALHAEC